MIDSKGRLVECKQCRHGRWVYILRHPDSYACQLHGWRAEVYVVQMKILKKNSRSWEQAWAQLEAKYGSRECLDEATGETWQYMTTSVKDDDRVEHQFRHRALPGKKEHGGREYFAAHGTFDPEEYQ